VLLDAQGIVISVNEAWRQLAEANRMQSADGGLGLNYLALCDGAWGPDSPSAHATATGIRSVLHGETKRFEVEYTCDSPEGTLWFLLIVTPLDEHAQCGAVVLHVDITDRKRDQQSLLQFAAAMDAAMDAIYLTDPADMTFLYCNAGACRMQRKTREEILAAGPAALLGIPEAELALSYDELIAGATAAEPIELLRHRADQSVYWLELRRQAQRLDGRWVIVSLIRDVTERKLADQRIAQLKRVEAMLSGINSLIVRVRDRAELFKEACNIAVRAGGFAMAWVGILDRGLSEIVPVASVGATELLLTCIEDGLSMKSATANRSATVNVVRHKAPLIVNDLRGRLNLATGRIFAQAGIRSFAKLPLIVGEEAVGVLALYSNHADFFHADEMHLLTELAGDVAFAIDYIEKQERIEYLAFYDPLTGLANRALFLDRVSQFLRGAVNEDQGLSLVLIDIERFRNINDSLGRPAGDELLRQVAARLTQRVGDVSRLARVGADHFALVLPGDACRTDQAELIEATLQAFLKPAFTWKGASYRFSAKTGVAVFPEAGTDAETLFANAEAALKAAKTGADAYLFYATTMRESAVGRLSLENRLRQALEQQQFVLHYQPKISLANGKLMGAEALIRWNDPNTGLVPPGRFIPMLEETGLINEVGYWALQKAVEDYLCWQCAGLWPVRIAVNVSPLQLGNRGFVKEVERIVDVHPQAASALELEITESLIMADVKHSVASLQKIRSMGLTVAIDDFGTGFSSLSYLAKLPINTLKIDRSFVTDLATKRESNILVAMIINLAHSLQLNVVAEGVETEQQANIVSSLGCDQVQGFLYGRPVPAAEFSTKFLKWKSS
jgi:diguanylate cyclase (GGDEF)-like protein